MATTTQTPAADPPHPVTLVGHLDPQVSRGLWLVKWLLVVPHAIVLFFLWVAVLVLSVVAWCAILVTGRYPRHLFDFTLGVMRWSWRVWFYAYGALGTDRYPPFTLADVPDYPARLDIAYPERLSRGLVLVKSWVLAVPHYLVLAFFLGIGTTGGRDGRTDWPWSVGLVGLLVLVAAVVLLFTGRYPRPVFDLVVGMDRWAARVGAYALLMTDSYPPFRLDQGGDDSPLAPAPPAPPAPGGRRWTAPRIAGLTVGSGLLTLALGSVLAGGALLVADKALRDDDGFLRTDGERFTTATYAVTSDDVRLDAGRLVHRVVGDVRLTADAGRGTVLIGIARTADVDRYLDGVAHTVVTEIRDGSPRYRDVTGTAPTRAPADAVPWAAYATGSGPQTLRWDATSGHWTVVLMNADGSGGVSAVVTAGATLPVLGWGAATLLVTGAVLLIGGLVLVLLALPRPPGPPTGPVEPGPVPPPVTAGAGSEQA